MTPLSGRTASLLVGSAFVAVWSMVTLFLELWPVAMRSGGLPPRVAVPFLLVCGSCLAIAYLFDRLDPFGDDDSAGGRR